MSESGSPRARPEGKQPDGPRGIGRSLVVSDQRCKERERGDATQQAVIITKVHATSSTIVIIHKFRFAKDAAATGKSLRNGFAIILVQALQPNRP